MTNKNSAKNIYKYIQPDCICNKYIISVKNRMSK